MDVELDLGQKVHSILYREFWGDSANRTPIESVYSISACACVCDAQN